jgi:hypothetical protein
MEVRMPTPLGHTSTMASIGASKPALHIARNPLPPFKRSTCSRMPSRPVRRCICARDMGRACFSRVAGTPDNAPASPRVVGVPAEWRALSEYTLNEGQEQTMAALAMGGNVLSRQPTGSGKSYTYLLPAIAQWAAIARARARCADERTRDKLPLPPICIVVAPFRALCEDAEYQASLFLAGLYEAELLPTVSVLNRQSCARALFVDRFVEGGVVEMLASNVVSDSTSAVVAAADAAPTVDSLPCGRCSLTDLDLDRSRPLRPGCR